MLKKCTASAASIANIPVSAGTTLDHSTVAHGDCYPDGSGFLCTACDVFWPADHFVTPHPFSMISHHSGTDHLARYFDTLNYRGRAVPRKYDPQRNFFTMMVFAGHEPSRELARQLSRLILRSGPIDTTALKSPEHVEAAVAVDHYRRAMGDDL
jgi:hypothetical protein